MIRDLPVVIYLHAKEIRHGGQGSLRIATRVELGWSVLSLVGFSLFLGPPVLA